MGCIEHLHKSLPYHDKQYVSTYEERTGLPNEAGECFAGVLGIAIPSPSRHVVLGVRVSVAISINASMHHLLCSIIHVAEHHHEPTVNLGRFVK